MENRNKKVALKKLKKIYNFWESRVCDREHNSCTNRSRSKGGAADTKQRDRLLNRVRDNESRRIADRSVAISVSIKFAEPLPSRSLCICPRKKESTRIARVQCCGDFPSSSYSVCKIYIYIKLKEIDIKMDLLLFLYLHLIIKFI